MSLEPGDLVFFYDSPTETSKSFHSAVTSSSRELLSATPYHVALVSAVHPLISLIQAVPSRGVVEQNLIEFLTAEGSKKFYRPYSVQLPMSLKLTAIRLARLKLTCGYNDIFSPDCINSNGHQSYYCCQLVAQVYQLAAGWPLFSRHKMKFGGSNGEILPFWREHFSRLGHPIPENQWGTHPALLLTANFLAPLDLSRL